ncbi:bifunctional DNA-formamidopyrimidine glycosylase/DNA-(apurinic or apyrimidinic site) lyase [Patescibacteria group bacterium]|nr:bifunctional DNA-formamidopyrimidine glycosylase/DNA-(apurinic or apyrimidinic site) lyase [Patescibacteria group bacterium]
MPELPEVTTITNQLKKEVVGKKISSVFINQNYKVYPSNEEFIKDVLGSKVRDVFRIAKVIVIEIKKGDEEKYIAIHLAMTGRLQLAKDSPYLVKCEFEDKSKIVFADQRRFGYVKLLDEVELAKLKNKYGPDPSEVTAIKFEKRIKSKNTNIKNALLDQQIIAGIGNIYANEALFMAKIHPKTRTNNITTQQYSHLLAEIKQVLSDAIKHKGSTLSDLMYSDIYGKYGEHQKYFKIYGKQNENCAVCKTRIEFIILNGRGTYFCPACQKLCL